MHDPDRHLDPAKLISTSNTSPAGSTGTSTTLIFLWSPPTSSG
jgi:hypothetical protein